MRESVIIKLQLRNLIREYALHCYFRIGFFISFFFSNLVNNRVTWIFVISIPLAMSSYVHSSVLQGGWQTNQNFRPRGSISSPRMKESERGKSKGRVRDEGEGERWKGAEGMEGELGRESQKANSLEREYRVGVGC